MPFKFLLLVLLCCLLLGCGQKALLDGVETSDSVKVIKMPDISKEIYLPTELWNKVTGASFEKSVQQSSSFQFAPITLILEERSEGVLKSPKFQIEFPNGGGEADLAQFIQNSKGTFKVKFAFEGFASPETLQIFYVSKGKKRKIDSEIYGSGCQSYFDLQSYVRKVNEKNGIEVNVTRDRHLSTLAGHFVFSYKKEKQVYLSQITFTDSRRPDLLCEKFQPNTEREI